MISYKPLYKTLKEKGITFLELSKMTGCTTDSVGMSLRKGNINTDTLYQICKVLDCDIKDVIEYTEEEREDKSRVNVDWELLSSAVASKGYTLTSVALKIGRNASTFTNSKRLKRGIKSIDLMNVCKLIGEESSKFIK